MSSKRILPSNIGVCLPRCIENKIQIIAISREIFKAICNSSQVVGVLKRKFEIIVISVVKSLRTLLNFVAESIIVEEEAFCPVSSLRTITNLIGILNLSFVIEKESLQAFSLFNGDFSREVKSERNAENWCRETTGEEPPQRKTIKILKEIYFN